MDIGRGIERIVVEEEYPVFIVVTIGIRSYSTYRCCISKRIELETVRAKFKDTLIYAPTYRLNFVCGS